MSMVLLTILILIVIFIRKIIIISLRRKFKSYEIKNIRFNDTEKIK